MDRNYNKTTFSSPKETQLGVVALWRSFTIQITQTQEEHGVPPNKHYEIPFERGYTVLFPSHYLVKTATGYIAKQETPHRLHSQARDDCNIPINYVILKARKEEPSTCS